MLLDFVFELEQLDLMRCRSLFDVAPEPSSHAKHGE